MLNLQLHWVKHDLYCMFNLPVVGLNIIPYVKTRGTDFKRGVRVSVTRIKQNDTQLHCCLLLPVSHTYYTINDEASNQSNCLVICGCA